MIEATCKCVRCPECKGAGHIWYAFDGEYLGSARCDDLDEMGPCDTCQGSGVTETCDSCRDEYQEQMDREVDW
jgi:hypothetical protein